MTLHTILVSGVLKCITELPERPFVSKIYPEGDVFDRYERALESAKNNAIPFEDQEMIEGLLDQHCNWRKPSPFDQPIENQIHSFEYSGRIERVVEHECKHLKNNPPSVCGTANNCDCPFKTVIRLIPESKEESQEPPKPVIDFAVWYSGMDRHKVINAYNRYLRETRKPLNHGTH
jgi:hypothetical protein